MNRLNLLAAAMLLAVPIISACGDELPPPPPTGSIDGLVSIEGQGVDAVSVTLSNGASATTANGGMFRFDGVEAGAYTVTISNYPADASFDQTSAAATISTDGETVTINFPGTFIRTSSIMGTVTVENEGLSGITVTLMGTGQSETLTDGNGQYTFTGLRAGNYTVEISGFDDEDVAFGGTASSATVAVGESKVVSFEGTYLRTSAITGQVSVEGNPLDGVTVSMQGRGEDRSVTTNSAGQFTFSELRSGDYAVGISGFDIDQYGFEVTSRTVTVAHGETATVPFAGILLRSATIMGTVTVEGTGIADVLVTIQGNGEEEKATTNAAGQYSITDLPAGEYSVGISGFDDDEYGFDVTTSTVTVELKETATVPFEGIMLRTAGIEGTVTVEGHALPGVTVTVSGKGEEHTRVTNAAGYYMVDKLHAGDYAVAISNFDATEYEFPSGTTTTITVALRKTETVAFQGDLLRTAGISGRVSVEGTGLDSVMVTMSGDADATAMTADGGQYAFTGLAEGDYKVAIEGWDAEAYSFEMTEATLPVGDGAAVVQNFDGLHTRTASVSGKLFLDEVDSDGMYTEGEPAFAQAGIPLLLQGPGVSDVKPGMSMEDGSYAFDSLRAGAYRVLINMSDTVAAGLTKGGYRFSGELTGAVVSAAAGKAAMVNFPFRIVMQTILAGAVMGNATTTGYRVAGVAMELYPTVEDLAAGTNVLGMETTDTLGHAKFDFPRMADLGPGGQGTDNLVFVRVTDTGHDDLVVSDNAEIEIEYEATDRVSGATTAVRLLNLGVNFRWSVKSDADAKDGNEFLPHWKAVMGTDTIATNAAGLASYSGTLESAASLPDSFTVMLDTIQVDTLTHQGEKWVQTKALTFVHDGMTLPANDTANDLGPIYVTFTTQKLVVGVYREADDEPGYTNYRGPGANNPDDGRPHAEVGKDMTVELMTRDSRNRLQVYPNWDDDCDDDGVEEDPTEAKDARGNFGDGMFTFDCLDATEEFTVRFRVGRGGDRVLVSESADLETFDVDLTAGSWGTSLGAFGEQSGGVPEVRMCQESEGTSDDECATFGYQWMTGTLSGNVGVEKNHVITIEAETRHGATGDDDKTDTDGAYSFTGLQDGEYMVTAASGSGDYTISDTPANPNPTSVTLYHDEEAWAEANDDDDIEYDGDRAFAEFETTRQGLSIMGYVANDGDNNNLIRGDEAMAGITVRLLTDVEFDEDGVLDDFDEVTTTETTGNGFYSFTGLNNATDYWVEVVAGDASGGYRDLSDDYPNLLGELAADNYPALPEESTYRKPRWDRGSNSIVSGTDGVEISDDQGTTDDEDDDVSATLHNFALVYSNGTVAGSVSNMSGSSANIDVRVTTDIDPDSLWERATGSSGDFSVEGVLEGIYTAVIEDVGWAAPNMTAAGVPDDDAEPFDHDDDGTTGPEIVVADRLLTGTVEGRSDYQSMGTLYVYNDRMSAEDSLTGLSVMGIASVTEDAEEVELWIYADPASAQDVDGSDAIEGLTLETIITWASGTVTVKAAVSEDASYTVKIGDESFAVDEDDGAEVTLPYYATDAEPEGDVAVAGTDRKSPITISVTGENGYNDHDYTFELSRAFPVGYTLKSDDVNGADGAEDGLSTQTAWTAATVAGDSTARIVVNLEFIPGPTEECGQTVVVKDEDVEKEADEDSADCEPEYTLSGASTGNLHTIAVTSQDGKTETYYLWVNNTPPDAG